MSRFKSLWQQIFIIILLLSPAFSAALEYSTFLGGSGSDIAYGIAIDSAGNAYITGQTDSANFPTTAGAYATSSCGGSTDAFVTKLNPSGTALVYSTYLGGKGTNQAKGIVLDTDGNAYITGYTYSSNFPTTPGAYATNSCGGVNDIFITKLNPAGSALVYSTYLGGAKDDQAYAIALDTAGNTYITGNTNSANFPITAGAFAISSAGGTNDSFVTKLNPAGSALVYSTYLGGSKTDYAMGITIDTTGNAYITGYTGSPNFPTTAGAYATSSAGGTYDAFVTKLNPAGSALVYSTYLGGKGTNQAKGIVLDTDGNAYITGNTNSAKFPTTAGAYATSSAGGTTDAFVTKINLNGSGLVYSTYLGGAGVDYAYAIALDTAGNAYITGLTNSANFPITAGAYTTSFAGGTYDAFVTKFGDIPVPVELSDFQSTE